jgi:hypothetical protein
MDGLELLDIVDAVLGWDGDEDNAMGGDGDGSLARRSRLWNRLHMR